MDSDILAILLSGVGCVMSIVVLVGVILLAVFAIKKSKDVAKQSELNLNRIMSRLPQDKQMVFMMQYNSAKKDPTIAAVLALFLGGIGAHKFYMGQIGLGVVYLLFSWTGIPTLIGWVEAFLISSQVAKHNEQKAMEISMMIGGASMGL
jgi:TM2 domain-containing membrane protein YozV